MMDEASRQPDVPTPPRFDPWSGQRFWGLRWLGFSAVLHVGLLFLFGTITLTVIKKVEQIKVSVLEDSTVGEYDWEGEPSLRDLEGVLEVQRSAPEKARPRGPIVKHLRAPKIPRLAGIGPKLGAGPTIDPRATQLSFGAGAIGGLGGSFGDYVGGLRKVGLDIALVIDTTESMQFIIDEVKERLTQLVTAIHRMVPTARIGIVVYRDYGDDYVVKWTDLSFRTDKLRDFLSDVDATGGGDWEEAVERGIEAARRELSWRKKSKKIIVLVGGSPPHPEDVDDVRAQVQAFRRQGGYVSTVDVTERLHEEFQRELWRSLHGKEEFRLPPLPEYYAQVAKVYAELAKNGGGEMVRLDQQKALIREVVSLAFGSRWKVEMAKFLNELT